jgi:hypothetical protein
MHTEHLRNVQFSWVAFGWFVGLAAAAAVLLLLAGAGLSEAGGAQETLVLTVAVAVGWFVGGFIVGFKSAAAPILHGAAMAMFTWDIGIRPSGWTEWNRTPQPEPLRTNPLHSAGWRAPGPGLPCSPPCGPDS